MDLQTAIRQFIEYCEIERGHSPLTIRNYQQYLARFHNWANKQKITKPEEINDEVIRHYRLYLSRLTDRKDTPLKKITLNYHLIALRSFLKFLAKKDISALAPEKIELSSTEERQITFLTPEEVEILLNAPDLKTIQGLRDRAMLETLYSTGLRVSELVHLKRDQVNIDRGEFTVLGKGGRVRIVFLSNRAKRFLKRFLKARTDNDPYVFIRFGRSKNPLLAKPDEKDRLLTPRTIQRLIHHYAVKSGITKPVTPHTMRHSFATDLISNGADLRSVQTLLGHLSVTTTQIYTHITNPQLKKVHETFHGQKNASLPDDDEPDTSAMENNSNQK